MKCPKCGYNSFDHLENCKKCGGDMVAHRTRFGFRRLFPRSQACKPAAPATLVEETVEGSLPEDSAASAAPTDFGLDFMGEEVSDEGPVESSLDELLDPCPQQIAQGFSAQQKEISSESSDIHAPAEERDDALIDATDFDFTWEEELRTGDGKAPGEEPTSLSFPGFAENNLDLSWDIDPTGASVESFDQDSERTSERSHEELPEFAFEEEPAEVQGDSSCIFEEEALGKVFDRTEQPPMGEDTGDSAGGAPEPLTLSKSLPATEPFSWGDTSDEPSRDWNGPSGSSEPNLAEIFLESLEEKADSAESTNAASISFADEDLFGNFSSEVVLVESELQELPEDLEEAETEKSAAPPSPPLTTRIGAGIADLIILVMVFILFFAAGEVASGSGQIGGLFPSLANLLDLAIPYFLVLFAVCFGYFTLFHFLIGQTPGKMLFRIRVVGEAGSGLMFSQAFLRSVGGLLSLLPAGLGYLRVAVDRERRGWNDRLANSRVISAVGWESLEELNEEGVAEEGY